MIQLSRPCILPADLERHNDCLLRGRIDPGPIHRDFQQAIAARLGVPANWVLLTNSGTAALEVAGRVVRAWSVAFPAMSWPSTWSWHADYRAWLDVTVGGTPVWPEHCGDALAAVPVALWGCQTAAGYYRGARRWFMHLVLDAAHDCLNPEHGRMLHEDVLDLVCYSFGPVKQMTCGRGGAAVGKKIGLYRHEAEAYIHSGTRGRHFVQQTVGRNFRMTEPAAALGLAQLERLDAMDQTRRNILWDYQTALQERLITIPAFYSGHLAVIRLPEGENRQVWATRLNERGIETGWHYPIPDCVPTASAPNAHALSRRVLSIPCHAGMTPEEVRFVAAEVARLFHESRPTDAPPPN